MKHHLKKRWQQPFCVKLAGQIGRFQALIDPMWDQARYYQAALMYGDVATGLMRDYFGFGMGRA